MQASVDTNVQQVTPMTVSITLENADDIRWFYHLMNQQAGEIQTSYDNSSKGRFLGRFVPFTVPDKKHLFHAVKQHAADCGVSLTH